MRSSPLVQFIESGWAEKLDFLRPLVMVPGIPEPSPNWTAFNATLYEALAAIAPSRPNISAAYVPLPDPVGSFFTCGRFSALLGSDGSLMYVGSANRRGIYRLL